MRMRLEKDAIEKIESCYNYIKEPQLYKGRWHEYFGNNNPIHVEFGMGKGGFIKGISEQNPNINYVGFEKFTKILVKATKKVTEEDPIALTRFDVEHIEEVFATNEVDRIYLNFSDPWPKDRHAKRRLTYKKFLNNYENILKDKGELHFKTDNKDLFDFSLEQLEICGWSIKYVTRDLHNSDYLEGNVMTEYETKFVALNQPIYKVAAFKVK